MSLLNKSNEDLFEQFNSSSQGLTSQVAKQKSQEFGPNALRESKKEPIWVKFLKQFSDPLIIILIIAAIVSLVVDPNEWLESLIIFVVVLLNALLGTIQENNAEKALESLKKMSAPNAKVYRDGKLEIIPAKDITVGDVVYIEAGDLVPSDGRIISAKSLKVDESSLTGESVPVEKIDQPINKEDVPLAEQRNMVFASTIVTYGSAYVLVTSIGMNNQIGIIASQLDEEKQSLTPLQLKLNQVSKTIGMLCIVICIIVFGLEVLENTPVLEAFKSAVALAVAAVPEGLATVVTVLLAIGVKDMVQHNAIVKKLPAVETLGSASVVCSDKTGTLTQNKMTVTHYYLPNYGLSQIIDHDVDPQDFNISAMFTLCSDASGSLKDNQYVTIGDPTETALLDATYRYGKTKDELYSSVELVDTYPFDSSRKLMSVAIKKDGNYYIITKGSPDALFELSLNDTKDAQAMNEQLASQALRVLAIGYKSIDPSHLSNKDLWEQDLEFVGLVAMKDPIKPTVKESVALAAQAGVKTVMITGDSLPTAKAIAKELNIISNDEQLAITGAQLDAMSDAELNQNVENIRVYARVSPSNKVRIVKAFQDKNEVVAMTGDGVNDSPALKASDIGCAMGITGTDVAKDSADMILMDDNFSTIIASIKQGRTIYNNIEKDIRFLLSSNIGEVITIFLASLLSLIPTVTLGTPLASIHLLFINLITDSLPAFALGFEKSEPDIMDRKPKPKTESIFTKKMWTHILIEGISVGLLTLISYIIGNRVDHVLGMTMAFVTLSSCELFHSFNVKTSHSVFSTKTFNNKLLNLSFIAGFILMAVVVYTPLNTVFNLVALSPMYLGIAIGTAALIIIVSEVEKLCGLK